VDGGGKAQRRQRFRIAPDILSSSKAPSRPPCRRTSKPGELSSGLDSREASWTAVVPLFRFLKDISNAWRDWVAKIALNGDTRNQSLVA
jgi:hypothetical protein